MAGGNVPSGLAPIFVAAGAQYHIPAQVLAGIASVETNLGANQTTSSTGARGLMQFEPTTAASLGVNVGNDRSEIFGAAKLLNQYGYQSNPLRAIASYNAGPNNYTAGIGYANLVDSESKRLAPQLSNVVNSSSGAIAPTNPGASSIAQQKSGAQPTSLTPGGVDWSAVALNALAQGEKPINPDGAFTASGGMMAKMLSDAMSGKYGTSAATSTPTTVVPTNVNPKDAQSIAQTGSATGLPSKVVSMTKFANSQLGKPYIWGGGHSGWGNMTGYDCSGFVSATLHAAGYLTSPQTTATLPSQLNYVQKGAGKYVTIYDRSTPTDGHVIMDINGQFYEAGGSAGAWGGGGGVEKIGRPSAAYLASFNTILHPIGL